MNVFAYGRIERGLGIVEGAQPWFQLPAGADQGVHRVVELALTGLGSPVADPQALLEECPQPRVHGLLGLDLAGGRLVGADRHHGMGALKAIAAILQIGLEAVSVIHQALQGAVASPGALVA
jgi:hypothetical protein